MRRTVYLYGCLAVKYGPKFEFEADSVRRVLKLLQANFPDFFDNIQHGQFHIVVGSEINEEVARSLSAEDIPMTLEPGDIHILPAISGAKEGWMQIVLGVVLIAVAWWNPGGWLGAGTVASMMISGSLMIIGGLVSMLTPTAKASAGDKKEDLSSYIMSGPSTRYKQGGPVPYIFGGPLYYSPVMISCSIYTEQMGSSEGGSGGAGTGGGSDVGGGAPALREQGEVGPLKEELIDLASG